jgi:hypothetical protein
MNAQEVLESAKLNARKKKPLPESYLNLWKKTTRGIELMEEIVNRHQIRCGLS